MKELVISFYSLRFSFHVHGSAFLVNLFCQVSLKTVFYFTHPYNLTLSLVTGMLL